MTDIQDRSAERKRPAKAFSVSPRPLNRRVATSSNPLSADWTLYDPAVLAEKLSLPIEVVSAALVETGFAKAVHVRMELVRWKERLRNEDRDLSEELRRLDNSRRAIMARKAIVKEALEGARNVLRLPRDPSGVA